MNDQGAPPEDEIDTPVVPMRLVAPNGHSLVESNPAMDTDGELDFKILGVQPRGETVMGPGSKGRLVPYWSYGWGAVCTPNTSLVGGDGKQLAIMVPLPPSGMMKMSEFKRLANKIWREAHRQKTDD